MYLESTNLLSKINEISERVAEETNYKVGFVEFIAVPYYGGNIVLRFRMSDCNYTLDDLSIYTNAIYNIVGNEFLIDFIGEVYQRIGIDYLCLKQKLVKFSEIYKDEKIIISVHCKKVEADTRYLLTLAGLDMNTKVWEIIIGDDITLMVLGKKNRIMKTIENVAYKKIYVIEAVEKECEGLEKATMFAKRNNISLGVLLKAINW